MRKFRKRTNSANQVWVMPRTQAFLPNRAIFKLQYYQGKPLSYFSSGSFSYNQWALNDLWDVDVTPGGVNEHQPMGRDQLALYYGRYKVLRTRYKVTYYSPSWSENTWDVTNLTNHVQTEPNPGEQLIACTAYVNKPGDGTAWPAGYGFYKSMAEWPKKTTQTKTKIILPSKMGTRKKVIKGVWNQRTWEATQKNEFARNSEWTAISSSPTSTARAVLSCSMGAIQDGVTNVRTGQMYITIHMWMDVLCDEITYQNQS